MSDEKVLLTVEQAIAMLPDGDEVHTFRSTGGMLLGDHWDREHIIKAITESSVRELAGPAAMSMNHGLAIDSNGWLFVATSSLP